MARINSSAIGKGSGSAGVFTYRTVRGRTIASSRVTVNKSCTILQVRQRESFAEMQRLGKAFGAAIGIGFDKTRYGSARNNFIRQNTSYMDYLRNNRGMQRHIPPIHNLWLALSDERFRGQVLAASGENDVTASFRWDTSGSPVVQIVHYRPFQSGDTLTFVLGVSFLLSGKRFSRLALIDRPLLDADITGLANEQLATFDKTSCPQLDFSPLLPAGADDIRVVAAAIVTGPEGEHSTSYFTAMPLPAVICTASGHNYLSGGKMEILFPSAGAFPPALVRDALGASLCFPGLTVSQSYMVTAFVQDGQGQSIGLVVEDGIGHDLQSDPKGDPSVPCPLTKNGQAIALIGGLFTPAVMP